MASPDLYEAVVTFLDGNSGDIRSGLNTELGGSTLATGSVVTSRGARGSSARREKAPSPTIEIVPRAAPRRWVGLGFAETDVVVDLQATVRRKDKPEGDTQLDSVEDLARALHHRYHGRSNLSISVSGSAATFRRSSAEIVSIDELASASTEYARAVVRVTFTFSHAQETDT